MNPSDDTVERAVKLRWRAEELARDNGALSLAELGLLSPEEIQRIIHELRVHEIELKIQNDELRRTQVELDVARARYFDLYDLAPVGYCIVSMDGLILETNLTAVTLLGLARAALLRQPITRFICKDDQDIYYRHRKQLFETGEPQACELRMVKQDGTVFWVRVAATTAPGPATSPPEATESAPLSRVVLSDITELKRVEEEKAELAAQLQRVRKHHTLRPGPNKGGTAATKK